MSTYLETITIRFPTPHICCAAQSVLILILLGELTSPLQNLWYFARYLKDRSQVRHMGGAPAAATRQSAHWQARGQGACRLCWRGFEQSSEQELMLSICELLKKVYESAVCVSCLSAPAGRARMLSRERMRHKIAASFSRRNYMVSNTKLYF